MIELATAFVLGAISIFSPCVLPVLPIIIAGSGANPLRAILVVAGIVTGTLFVALLSFGILLAFRLLAYAAIALFAFTMFFDPIEERISRTISKLSPKSLPDASSPLLGFFLSFVWLPCTAPFVGVATSQAAVANSLAPVFSYSAGMAASTALVIKLGGDVIRRNFTLIKKLAGVMLVFYLVYSLL